jgi:hypothetical protein
VELGSGNVALKAHRTYNHSRCVRTGMGTTRDWDVCCSHEKPAHAARLGHHVDGAEAMLCYFRMASMQNGEGSALHSFASTATHLLCMGHTSRCQGI